MRRLVSAGVACISTRRMSAWRSLRRYSSKEDLMRDDVIYLFSFGAFNSFERFLFMRYNNVIFKQLFLLFMSSNIPIACFTRSDFTTLPPVPSPSSASSKTSRIARKFGFSFVLFVVGWFMSFSNTSFHTSWFQYRFNASFGAYFPSFYP